MQSDCKQLAAIMEKAMIEDIRGFFDMWELFRSSVYSSVLVSISLSLIGVIALAQHMVFLTAALSQCAALGIALGFLIHGFGVEVSPMLAAFILTSILTFTSQHINQRHHMMGDVALGLIYIFAQSALLLVAPLIVGELSDINTLLFGSAVSSTDDDMWHALLVCIFTSAVFIILFPSLRAYLISPIACKVRGVPVRILALLIAVLMSLNVTVATPIVGALTVFSFTIIPAYIASKLVVGFMQSLLCAATIGASAAFIGFITAFIFDTPVGPTQSMLLVVTLACVFITRRSR